MPDWLKRLFGKSKAPAAQPVWRKFDLIHALADIHGYRSLLEISTATTAGSYPSFNRSKLDVCQRLSYLTPEDWSDGAPIDYRSPDLDTSECMRQIRERGLRFDIVFVDAWHEYETARRDLQDALELVSGEGLVLAHDCLPQGERLCSPLRGMKLMWFGVSYKLYLDFLLSRDDLWYCTVNTDHGCGMVRMRQKSPLYRRAMEIDAEKISTWRKFGEDYTAAYRFYIRHRGELMNIVTVDQFLAAEKRAVFKAIPGKSLRQEWSSRRLTRYRARGNSIGFSGGSEAIRSSSG